MTEINEPSFGARPGNVGLNPLASGETPPIAPTRDRREDRGRIEVTPAEDEHGDTPTVHRPFSLEGLFGSVTLKERNRTMRLKSMDKDGGELDNAIRVITGKFPSMLNHPALMAKARELAAGAGKLDDIEAWFREELNKENTVGSEAVQELRNEFKKTWPYFAVTNDNGNQKGIVSCRVGKRKLSDHLTGQNYVIFQDHKGNSYFYDGKSVSVKLKGAVTTKEGVIPAEKFGKKHAEYMMTALVLDHAGKKNPDGTPKDYTITVGASGLFGRPECRDLCLIQTLKLAHETGSMATLTMRKDAFFWHQLETGQD